MRLKYQLLLLGLLSLLLPITGWFALKSVDKEFRQSIEQASKNTLTSLQASVNQIVKNNSDIELNGLVLTELDEISVDGYDNEWKDIIAYEYKNFQHSLNVKIATNNNNLALFITSNDKVISINPTNIKSNDYVVIGLANKRGLHQYKYYRQAEGLIKPERMSKDGPSNQAYWHETANGYTLEVLFKHDDTHNLGFANVNFIGKDIVVENTIAGTLNENPFNTLKLLPIVSNNNKLQQIITDITPQNNQFTIQDNNNRVIYTSNKLPNSQKASAWQWLITPVYQWLFGIDDNHNWFYRQSDGMAGISHSIKEDKITYNLKSMLPQGQQNMIQTLLKAAILMIVVVILIMLSYLLYSLILAWRIKKLNNAMQSVLDDSGRVHIQMPSHLAKDEIGQLSRGIETMLTELREYTQYLKDLGSRLSHEMKTPLAIVQTSLDNLEQEQDSEFLQRAKQGTNRLKFILNQLSELSQLKYTLENTPKQLFDLTGLCQQLGESYQSYIPNLKLNITSEKLSINGSEDLIAQLIDKLMENAKDFTPTDGYIELKLYSTAKNICLVVSNTGSQLPKNQQLNIFDSLISLRSKQVRGKTHLGLGLYIVQLISRYHNCAISAKNTRKPDAVEFTLTFVDN